MFYEVHNKIKGTYCQHKTCAIAITHGRIAAADKSFYGINNLSAEDSHKTSGIKADCNHLMRTTTPTLASGDFIISFLRNPLQKCLKTCIINKTY